jgi:rubredoxin
MENVCPRCGWIAREAEPAGETQAAGAAAA